MKLALRNSILQYLIKHRNAYLGLAALSLCANILLAIVIITLIGHERIILVPPIIDKRMWVNYNSVSAAYLAAMSEFFIDLRFNVTPDSIAKQREILLHYVDTASYATLKGELIAEEERINKEHISLAFYLVDVKVDTKKLQALITGDLVTTVAAHTLPGRRLTYKLSYRYHDGVLLVKSLEEAEHV